jgi:hypothetical protein
MTAEFFSSSSSSSFSWLGVGECDFTNKHDGWLRVGE